MKGTQWVRPPDDALMMFLSEFEFKCGLSLVKMTLAETDRVCFPACKLEGALLTEFRRQHPDADLDTFYVYGEILQRPPSNPKSWRVKVDQLGNLVLSARALSPADPRRDSAAHAIQSTQAEAA